MLLNKADHFGLRKGGGLVPEEFNVFLRLFPISNCGLTKKWVIFKLALLNRADHFGVRNMGGRTLVVPVECAISRLKEQERSTKQLRM